MKRSPAFLILSEIETLETCTAAVIAPTQVEVVHDEDLLLVTNEGFELYARQAMEALEVDMLERAVVEGGSVARWQLDLLLSNWVF